MKLPSTMYPGIQSIQCLFDMLRRIILSELPRNAKFHQFREGFSSGSLSYTSQTKTVKYGEEVTIYAEGDEIVGDYSVTHYYCIGFYLDSGAAIKTFSDTNRLHSYTFTATKDMDISADWKKYDY